jgi:hypothetical protein
MSEKFLVVGGGRGTIPTSDFLSSNDYFGPKGGVYYVDGNVAATGGGSPDHPYATLAEAITASNAAIALSANRWWARRNRIYVCGDALSENLTAFPTKCDVIGCGSYDGFSKAGLSGRHVPATEAYGTRWYNMHFKAVAHASAIHTLAGAASNSGIEYHGCTFDGTLGTMTSGILSTAMPFLKVVDCDFIGTFVTSYISFGAGEAGGARIMSNRMLGTAAKGIVGNSGTTTSWKSLIDDNIIYSTGQWVDDDSDLFFVTNNTAITDIDCATYTAGFDFNLLLASGNKQTGSNAGDHDSVPHLLFA